MRSRGGTMDIDNQMYVIWHNNVFVNKDIIVIIAYIFDWLFYNFTDGCEVYLREGAETLPYNVT